MSDVKQVGKGYHAPCRVGALIWEKSRLYTCTPLSHSRPHTTLPTQRKHTGREQDIPFALGSCVLNLLCAFVDTLGVPVLRFIENLRLASDIFFSISRADSAIFAVLLGFGLGSRLAGRFRGLVIRRGCCSRKCRKEELA